MSHIPYLDAAPNPGSLGLIGPRVSKYKVKCTNHCRMNYASFIGWSLRRTSSLYLTKTRFL